MIRFENFGGKKSKNNDIAKRVIVVARGFFMRLLKLRVEVLIL